MMKNEENRMSSLADAILKQNQDLFISNFLSFIYIADIIDRYLEIGFRQAGLTRTQNRIMSFLLSSCGSMTPTELSHYAYRTKDSTTKAINQLDKMGLTRSTRSTKGRRLRKVSLTDKGLDILEKILPVRYKLFRQAMDYLTKKENLELQDLLQKLQDRVIKLSTDSIEEQPGKKISVVKPLTYSDLLNKKDELKSRGGHTGRNTIK
jgi:DNA-binding MarR family transcriptional regulator